MAIKHVVTAGFGIASTGVKYIPTRGYVAAAVVVATRGVGYWLTRMRRRLADED